MRKAIKAHTNLHTKQQNEHTPVNISQQTLRFCPLNQLHEKVGKNALSKEFLRSVHNNRNKRIVITYKNISSPFHLV